MSDKDYNSFLDRSILYDTMTGVTTQRMSTADVSSSIGNQGIDYSQIKMEFVPGENLQSSSFSTGITGWALYGDGSIEANDGTFRGIVTASSIAIPNLTTADSFHADTSGNTWWGSTAIGTATATILNTGSATFTDVTITGGNVASTTLSGLIALTNLDVASQGWVQTCVFSSTSATSVSWTSGTLTAADGTDYSISAGGTGEMSAKTYIYLDTAISVTAYQVSATATSAVGTGKILVAVAEDGTNEATFRVVSGGEKIDAESLAANSITANQIAASTITAGLMNVGSLSSITADLGTVTAGTITLNGAGYIRGGQTDYETGDGYFLGYSGGDYKFSIGDADNYTKWDGSYLRVKGSVDINTGGLLNVSTYTVANLPSATASEGFNNPSAYE